MVAQRISTIQRSSQNNVGQQQNLAWKRLWRVFKLSYLRKSLQQKRQPQVMKAYTWSRFDLGNVTVLDQTMQMTTCPRHALGVNCKRPWRTKVYIKSTVNEGCYNGYGCRIVTVVELRELPCRRYQCHTSLAAMPTLPVSYNFSCHVIITNVTLLQLSWSYKCHTYNCNRIQMSFCCITVMPLQTSYSYSCRAVTNVILL